MDLTSEQQSVLSLCQQGYRDVARLFKMRGRKGGSGVSGGADWDSKWWLSIILLYKVLFHLGGKRGAEFLPGGSCPPPRLRHCRGTMFSWLAKPGRAKHFSWKKFFQHLQVQHGVAEVGITATTGKAALPLSQWTNRTFFFFFHRSWQAVSLQNLGSSVAHKMIWL